MNTLKSIEVGVLTVTRLRTREKGRLFLDLLFATAPEYAPGRFNTHEPVNRPFNANDYTDAMQSWGMGFLWRGRRPSVAGQIVMGPLTVHDAV